MAKIPSGSFFFGSDNPLHFGFEKPFLDVKIKEFYLDVHEVSAGQYKACVDAGKCESPKIESKSLEHPVRGVNWDQARAYCKFAGGDLPSEAQWEYGAKGGNSLNFPWGNSLVDKKLKTIGLGMISFPSKRDGPVGVTKNGKGARSQYGSPFGLAHVQGNVSEWVLDTTGVKQDLPVARKFSSKILKDRFASDYVSKEKGDFRVVKGASFATAIPSFQRSSFRLAYKTDSTHAHVGFRCMVPGK